MEPGSSIVNISSVLALIKSYAPQAAYFASEMTADVPDEVLLPFISAHSPLGRLGLQHELDAAVVFSPALPRPTSRAPRSPWTVACPDTDLAQPRCPFRRDRIPGLTAGARGGDPPACSPLGGGVRTA